MALSVSAVTEWTGSAIINNLVDKAFSFLGELLRPADTEAELNRLNALVPKITAVMKVAEALKLKYPNSGVDACLQQFNLAFQAAEDVLDELQYLELQETVKNIPDQVGGSSSSSSYSVVHSLKRKFRGSNTINGNTLGRLREAVRLLDQASKDVALFDQLAAGLGLSEAYKVSSRETSCILSESDVVGRETEKATIIDWLKKPAPHTQISAFSIVGLPGLGKTTLAQFIYEKMEEENLFDEISWACVSTTFNVQDITWQIVKEKNEKRDLGEPLNHLQERFKGKVISKKVLLILDDVWDENEIRDWEKLIAPLRFVKEGSKILLTTRMQAVADMLGRVLNVEVKTLDLRGMEEPHFEQLFIRYAFHGHNPDNEVLKKIGNEIVKKLWGNPLAAKVIGSLLNSNMDPCFWRRILKCNSLIDLEQAKEVADVLKLSYYHLSADLQQCFRFCSIFPQDHSFKKNKLIRMWMAAGFIRQHSWEEERPEDIGEGYLNDLCRKSFFQQKDIGCGGTKSYILHDLMHELAQNVSKGECFRADGNNEKFVNIPSTVKHVSVLDCEIERVFHLRNLHTLVITMPPWYEKQRDYEDHFVLPDCLLKETLRILIIDVKRSYELPKEIDRLIHLRYLKVNVGSGSLISNSIYKLYHLQVLELFKGMHINSDYSGVETTGMTNLVSLRYVELPDEIMENVCGVQNLTSLQELTFFVGQDDGRHIEELKTLTNLQRLCINKIENVGDPAQAKNADLSGKESLLSLSLNWTEGSNHSDNQEQIIDNLEPPANLTELEIQYYQGRRSPIWMRNLPPLNLSSLKISNCSFWQDIPLLAQMPNLKELSLLGMSEVKESDYSFDTNRSSSTARAFPSLEELTCEGMPKWQSWAGSLHSHGFPNLKILTITGCPDLVDFPAMPLSLSDFTLHNVGVSDLPDIYHSSSITAPTPSSAKSSLRRVRIRACPNIKSLNGFMQQENLDFPDMDTLIISSCQNLVQLPTYAFKKFASLEYLEISRCPKLVPVNNQSIPLPEKLITLIIGDCGELDVTLLESASHLDALSNLDIQNSATVTCIPHSQNAFPSLSSLDIQGCEKLVPHRSMEIAQDVNPGNSMESLKINFIGVSHLSLLFIEPLRSLRFVSTCQVGDCYEMEAVPEQWLMQNSGTLKRLDIENASSLRSLPDTMVNLTALEQLSIENASLLEQIPDLPPSLVELNIKNASSLRSLPDTMARHTALKKLNIENATLLEHIPELPPFLFEKSITGADGRPLV